MRVFRQWCGEMEFLRTRMKRDLAFWELKKGFAALFFFAELLFWCGAGWAAGPESAGNMQRMEAAVIHVDNYAVYAPNLIFYFDTRMDKRKIETIKRTADRLRNRKAVFTYSSTGAPGQGSQMLLMDIAAAGENIDLEKPGHAAAPHVAEAQARPARKSPEEQAPLVEAAPVEPKSIVKQTVVRREEPQEAGHFDLITKEEINAFIHRLLDLNCTKDLAAVAPFYADRVDYYDRGVIGRDQVLQDLKYYYRNWVEIDTRLVGDVVMIVLDEPEIRIAKFMSSFSVRNEKKSVTGKTENIWRIRRINGKMVLIDVKQKILEKQSSAL